MPVDDDRRRVDDDITAAVEHYHLHQFVARYLHVSDGDYDLDDLAHLHDEPAAERRQGGDDRGRRGPAV
jgi:hypothetical protein